SHAGLPFPESIPFPPSSTAPASRRAGAATHAWPALHKDRESTHRFRRRGPFCPTRESARLPRGNRATNLLRWMLGIRRVAWGFSSPSNHGLHLRMLLDASLRPFAG